MTNVNNDYVSIKLRNLSLRKIKESALVKDSVMRNYVERHMGHFFNNVSATRGITLWLSMHTFIILAKLIEECVTAKFNYSGSSSGQSWFWIGIMKGVYI